MPAPLARAFMRTSARQPRHAHTSECVPRCAPSKCTPLKCAPPRLGLRAQVNWIREQIETPEAVSFSKDDKMRMLDRLCWSDHFEGFLAQKYATAKRFGLEGCEVLIVGMKQLIDTATVRPLASPLGHPSPSLLRPPCLPCLHRYRHCASATPLDLPNHLWGPSHPCYARAPCLASRAHPERRRLDVRRALRRRRASRM